MKGKETGYTIYRTETEQGHRWAEYLWHEVVTNIVRDVIHDYPYVISTSVFKAKLSNSSQHFFLCGFISLALCLCV